MPKIRAEHVNLTNFSRMRVDLAAQVSNVLLRLNFNFFKVLSESVASEMEFYDIPEAQETIRFIRIFDHAFDCLNVRTLFDK